MFGRSLLPSLWRQSDVPERRDAEHPFYSIQKEMNRLFDNFFQGLDAAPFMGEPSLGRFSPSIDIQEDEKAYVVKVELPGMDEKDVEVLLSDDALTIKGEKKEEKEDKGKNYYHVERSFGSFQRVIPLPTGIDLQKAEAAFKKGILSISLPKTAEAKAKAKKIAIKSEA
jgi:HSP20 family protein